MKMSDVFKLPMVCEDGDGFIYSKDLRHSIQFDDSDTYMMDHKKAVTHAINNHDRMADEIAELREFAKSAKFTMEKAKNHHPLPKGHDCEMLRQQVERACELIDK